MLLNRQRRIRLRLSTLEEFLRRACRELKIREKRVTVCLVENAAIAQWNRQYRGETGPTDVLSFANDPAGALQGKNGSRRRAKFDGVGQGAGRDCYLGDVAIAPAVARRNAERYGRTLHDEMRILILHGLLHLLGYDHETDEGQMERRERLLRRRLGLAEQR